ncbi:hypothetical protein [Virgibacillus sp. CBA3643]|uniref:hypothetical protein n=1 Tax=Virgibacillus sp. CBA3643 TaxID=2942278 RepID=UPI0035A2DB7F
MSSILGLIHGSGNLTFDENQDGTRMKYRQFLFPNSGVEVTSYYWRGTNNITETPTKQIPAPIQT